MSKKLAVLVGVVLCLTSMPLHAEDLTGTWGVSGIAGAAFPLGEKELRDASDDVGLDLGAMLRYGYSRKLSLGLSYENIHLMNDVRYEPVFLQALMYPFDLGKLAPVFKLGAGTTSALADGKFDNISAKVGAGLDYFITPRFSVGPHVDYIFVSEEGSNPVPAHLLTAGLQASMYWGGGESAAPAPKAAVAAPAPVAKGPVDSDKDGVNDDQDRCPATPTGVSVDSSGCPPDSDGDNVADYMDKCPNTMKGVAVSPEGCPLSTPEKVSIDLNVLFDTGKAVVKPEYEAEIQRVADFMKSYLDTKAEIEGHTDNVGNKAANVSLSQRRADAVRTVLVSKFGIASDRLTAKGYGPDKPLTDNTTVEGRSKNRRVVATVSAVKK